MTFSRHKKLLCLFAFLSLFKAQEAFAMHIIEGFLPVRWALFWFVLLIPFLLMGLWQLKRHLRLTPEYLPFLAMVGSAIFVVSGLPIPVPITGTCSHPTGVGLGAILVGPFPTILISFIALIFQAIFLGQGGLTTLGANVIAMGVGGSLCGFITYRALRAMRASLFLCGFVSALVADLVTYLITSCQLALALHAERSIGLVAGQIFVAFLPTQLPLAFLEAILTGGFLLYVLRQKPSLLLQLRVIKEELAT